MMECKSVAFKESDIEGRTFSGYASTWDKDQGGDIIRPGAFAKTISERASQIKVLWQHSEPIGKPKSMREDEKGLFVEAQISKTRLGDETLELIKDGVIDRMSIGYSVPNGKAEDGEDGSRIIKELKLYEFSPVTFPMNEAAIITGVKTIRDAVKIGKELDESSRKELAEMLEDLKALLTKEPVKTTQTVSQPPELDSLLESIKNFGLSARIN